MHRLEGLGLKWCQTGQQMAHLQTGTGAAEEEGSCGPELQQETPDQLERPKGEIWLWKKGTGTANM